MAVTSLSWSFVRRLVFGRIISLRSTRNVGNGQNEKTYRQADGSNRIGCRAAARRQAQYSQKVVTNWAWRRAPALHLRITKRRGDERQPCTYESQKLLELLRQRRLRGEGVLLPTEL